MRWSPWGDLFLTGRSVVWSGVRLGRKVVGYLSYGEREFLGDTLDNNIKRGVA